MRKTPSGSKSEQLFNGTFNSSLTSWPAGRQCSLTWRAVLHMLSRTQTPSSSTATSSLVSVTELAQSTALSLDQNQEEHLHRFIWIFTSEAGPSRWTTRHCTEELTRDCRRDEIRNLCGDQIRENTEPPTESGIIVGIREKQRWDWTTAEVFNRNKNKNSVHTQIMRRHCTKPHGQNQRF